MVEGMKSGVEAELEATNAQKYVSESQLKAAELELQTLLSKVDSLQEELCKEKDLHQKTADKEMAIAASRFAKCQKTIASISWQFKSLAVMDDFWVDSNESLQIQ
ncbi:hypothetical protein HAX54_021948 [Datura stramonium]|uniref:Uncharacterized protein n=1 Tax=Datura stramonium TaxID=4076 RepID=A0ABS8UTH4_DATST|nr:hypothetical protein [Datura stramonium]